MLSKIRKTVIAAIGAGVTAYATSNADGVVTTEELAYAIVLTLLTAYLTWRIPNRTEGTDNG